MSRKNNNNPLVNVLSKRIDGFNQRSLTYNDLAFECDRSGIEILQGELEETRGASLWVNDFSYIYLSSLLTRSELIVTGFHELCHLLLDPPGTEIFLSTGTLWNWSKMERHANMAGVIALIPDPEILAGRMSIAEIMAAYEVSYEIAKFRLDLFGVRNLFPI